MSRLCITWASTTPCVARWNASGTVPDWNAKLRVRALERARHDYEQQRSADRLSVAEDERRRILALATDFPAV